MAPGDEIAGLARLTRALLMEHCRSNARPSVTSGDKIAGLAQLTRALLMNRTVA